LDAAAAVRYARQIALAEVGPDGQARICGARVAVVGEDLAAEIAATYLRAAGVGTVKVLSPPRGRPDDDDGAGWTAALADVELVLRFDFDDDAMAGVAARLGVGHISARAQLDRVDLVAFPRRPPIADARLSPAVRAATPPDGGAAAVLAGTLAAAEALHAIIRGSLQGSLRDSVQGPLRESLPGSAVPPGQARHLRLPLDGGAPLVQAIGAPETA
jgi:hypothetical protein